MGTASDYAAVKPGRTSVVRAIALSFWAASLLAHAVAAIGAWALLPGGFPITHARFFSNRVMPALLLASVLGAAVLAARRSPGLPALLLVYPFVWLGLALAAGSVFPESGGRVASVAAWVALFLALGWAGSRWKQRALPRGAWLVTLPACALGAGFVLAQRAPEPSTRPFSAALPNDFDDERALSTPNAADAIGLMPWRRVDPHRDRVVLQAGAVGIVIEPLLEFYSRSPDRFWTVFASMFQVPPSRPGLVHVQSFAPEATWIETRTWLEAPVYSHLNSFARLSVSGQKRLGLRFSPCPAVVVEVVHSDYPFGAPARLAYLDAGGTFRVVQASNAEKGPFTTLAEGPLARGQPLGITLVELGELPPRELATIAFRDWSLQLSTDLSPTAGWGLPQNALEFRLASTDPTSPAHLSLTLAATSVGRGWDSVGHRAGLYTNGIEVRLPQRPR